MLKMLKIAKSAVASNDDSLASVPSFASSLATLDVRGRSFVQELLKRVNWSYKDSRYVQQAEVWCWKTIIIARGSGLEGCVGRWQIILHFCEASNNLTAI